MKALLLSTLLLFAGCASTVDRHATPEERQAITDARAAGDDEAADAIEENVLARVFNAGVALLSPFVPPPLMPIVPFLPALFLPRVRRLAGKSVKAAGTAVKDLATGKVGASGAKVGEAVEGFFELIGAKDSRKDPDEPTPPTP